MTTHLHLSNLRIEELPVILLKEYKGIYTGSIEWSDLLFSMYGVSDLGYVRDTYQY